MASRYSYEPEEPPPRGGWFTVEDKPTPKRTDKAFKVAALVIGLPIAAATLGAAGYAGFKTGDIAGAWPILALGLAGAVMAYVFVRAVGMVVVGIVGAIIDGPEVRPDWASFLHDIRLRVTWAFLLELALLLATLGMMGFSLIDAVNHRSAYSAAVFVLLACMTWWPFIRHRIKFGRFPD